MLKRSNEGRARLPFEWIKASFPINERSGNTTIKINAILKQRRKNKKKNQ
jgi:hypothetical protein